jgi:predicted nucleotidyltransferase
MQRKRLKASLKSASSKSKAKPSLEETKRMLREQLPRLRKEHDVGTLWLFGSYVQGEQHKRSDLDVLVEFREVPNLPEFIALESCLSDITGIKVDLVSIGSPKGDTCKRILSERVPV